MTKQDSRYFDEFLEDLALAAPTTALHHRLLSFREEAGLPEEIAALRVFDVIVDGRQGPRSGRAL